MPPPTATQSLWLHAQSRAARGVPWTAAAAHSAPPPSSTNAPRTVLPQHLRLYHHPLPGGRGSPPRKCSGRGSALFMPRGAPRDRSQCAEWQPKQQQGWTAAEHALLRQLTEDKQLTEAVAAEHFPSREWKAVRKHAVDRGWQPKGCRPRRQHGWHAARQPSASRKGLVHMKDGERFARQDSNSWRNS